MTGERAAGRCVEPPPILPERAQAGGDRAVDPLRDASLRRFADVGGLDEVVRIYWIRHWTEQGYDQVEDELGWADFRPRPGPRSPDQLSHGRLRLAPPYIPDEQKRR